MQSINALLVRNVRCQMAAISCAVMRNNVVMLCNVCNAMPMRNDNAGFVQFVQSVNEMRCACAQCSNVQCAPMCCAAPRLPGLRLVRRARANIGLIILIIIIMRLFNLFIDCAALRVYAERLCKC